MVAPSSSSGAEDRPDDDEDDAHEEAGEEVPRIQLDLHEARVTELPVPGEHPTVPSQASLAERFQRWGMIRDAALHDALQRTDRADFALPWPLESPENLGGIALQLPWWPAAEEPGALLPGLFETTQVFTLLDAGPGDRVRVIGSRGGWYAALLVRLGCVEVEVLEPDPARLPWLQAAWQHSGMADEAEAEGVEVTFSPVGADWAAPGGQWDRVLVTRALDELPLALIEQLDEDGIALVPVQQGSEVLLHALAHGPEGGTTVQPMLAWEVDGVTPEQLPLPRSDVTIGFAELGCIVHDRMASPRSDIPSSPDEVDDNDLCAAWEVAWEQPTRDRVGPTNRLRAIAHIWWSIDPHLPLDGEVSAQTRLRTSFADAMFRIGHVLHQFGVLDDAAEHQSASFNARPTAEAATFLGWSLGHLGDPWAALGWCRRAIETDPELGNPWNDVGAILIGMEHPEAAIPWLRRATEAGRYEAPGFPWLNLARAHEALGHPLAAMEAAREALRHMPGDDVATAIFERHSEALL